MIPYLSYEGGDHLKKFKKALLLILIGLIGGLGGPLKQADDSKDK